MKEQTCYKCINKDKCFGNIYLNDPDKFEEGCNNFKPIVK